jgi:microsomal dipeptidase-like Zn-dependent dipeptidase
MGLTYSESNGLGSGLREERDGDLTDLGRAAVRRMNKIGMTIDISHRGDQTSLDTIEAGERPILIILAGARGLWNTKRMKPDEVLTCLRHKGRSHWDRGGPAHDPDGEARAPFAGVGDGPRRVLHRAAKIVGGNVVGVLKETWAR